MRLPNDWKLKYCLQLSLVILLAMISLAGLKNMGVDTPILRQATGFVFLTFIPGFLILRVLKIHNLSTGETLVYTVGSSLAFIMFAGAFVNSGLHLVGVSQPITVFPVLGTFGAFILLLCGLAYIRDRDWDERSSDSGYPRLREILSPPYLMLILLPFVAVLGSSFVNFYQNNILLLIFIPLVAFIVALFVFNRLPRSAYSFAILMIGLSLLLHYTLISSQLSGGDIHKEFYFSNMVISNGYWDYKISGNLNTALSIVMLEPIYSLILNIDSIWAFKIIFPLLYCFAPLVLFHIFKNQIDTNKAFLAVFLFMSTPMFLSSTWGVRNQIAQFFFTLLILLMVERKLALKQRGVLFIIFALSLLVSHYGLGLIYTVFLVGGWIIVSLIRSRAIVIWEWLTERFGGLPRIIVSDRAFTGKMMLGIICIYLLFGLAWYGSIAQGSVLDDIKRFGQSQYRLFSTQIASLTDSAEPTRTPKPPEPTQPGPYTDPELREELAHTAFGLDFFSVSSLGQAFRVFQFVIQFFIAVGFIMLILKPGRFKAEYIGLTAIAVLILMACIIIPRLSNWLGINRFYYICLYLLTPLCITGGEVILHRTSLLLGAVPSRLKNIRILTSEGGADRRVSIYLKFLALAVLMPYFLFNTGFFFEITKSEQFAVNDSPSSIALSSYRLDMAVFTREDAEAAIHIAGITDDTDRVFADIWGRLILNEQVLPRVCGLHELVKKPEDTYVFLRTYNVDRQEIFIIERHGVQETYKHISFDDIPVMLEGRQLIYDNGGAQIWGPIESD